MANHPKFCNHVFRDSNRCVYCGWQPFCGHRKLSHSGCCAPDPNHALPGHELPPGVQPIEAQASAEQGDSTKPEASAEAWELAWEREYPGDAAYFNSTNAQPFRMIRERWRFQRGYEEGRASRDEEVERLRGEIARLREITTEEEPEKPGELDRLNPFKRGWVDNPAPAEQPANFIHGVRYYLGMLEDGDSWWHSLGHIESLCKDFQSAVDERAGKASEPSVTDEQLAKDISALTQYIGAEEGDDAPWRHDAQASLDRITAALAGRGVR
jgi:hypothetical protein